MSITKVGTCDKNSLDNSVFLFKKRKYSLFKKKKKTNLRKSSTFA
ncbi:hypothetical protein D920_02769 [Enterococcus faecalis 13-SD-W-01]|nr:hypothetical protein D920_02769 [Enterococcus faecalis 13-SD-W-01]